MEITVSTNPSTLDVRHLGLNMRRADAREVFASSGEDPISALTMSIDSSLSVWMFYGDDGPLCISGLAQITESIGAPWLLCSEKITEVDPKTFMKCSAALMETYAETFPVLMNYVDERNVVAKTWLQKLGFEEKETIPYGHSQLPFTRFEYTRKDNV